MQVAHGQVRGQQLREDGSQIMAYNQSHTTTKQHSLPRNLIPVYVNSVPARCLVDSGASHSVCSGELYRRVLKRKGDGNNEPLVIRKENRELLSADSSAMPAVASF